MICPKCEEGKLHGIRLKRTFEEAYICEFCGTFWHAGDEISQYTGHNLEAYGVNDFEYQVSESEADQEERSIQNSVYK